MGVIPDSEREILDLLDYLTEGSKRTIEITEKDGSTKQENVLDPEKIYWETRLVNHPQFSRYVLKLKKLESKATEAFDHMSSSRAQVIAKGILNIIESHKKSIDGKSSETLRDKHNSQQSLLHLLKSHKVEKALTLKGQAQKTLWDSLTGSEKKDETES